MKRYNFGKIAISLATATLIGFSGCGGSSSSDDTSGTTSGGTTTITTTGTISGSYYEGAIVCFDTDSDGSCTGETTVKSASDGSFSLTSDQLYSVIAEIPVGAKKHDVLGDAGVTIDATNTTIFAIPKDAITKAETQGGKVTISAISTKLYTYVLTNSSVDIDSAMDAVAAGLGVSKDDLLKDFNDPSVNAATRATLQARADSLLTTMQGKTSLDEIKTATASFVAAMSTPKRIDVVKAGE